MRIIEKTPLNKGQTTAIMGRKKKNLFIVSALAFLTFFTVNSVTYAAIDPSQLSGAQITEGLRNNTLSTQSVVQSLSKATNIPTASTQNLVSTIRNSTKLTNTDAGKLFDNLRSQAPNINAGNIGQVTSMVQNFQSGNSPLSTISNTVSQVAGGKLPVDLGSAASTIQGLGQLTQAKSIGDILKNPAVGGALQNLASQAKLPSQFTNGIGQLTQLASGPDAIKNIGSQLASGAIKQALSNTNLPAGVKNAISSAQNLQQLTQIRSVSDALQNPAVQGAVSGLLQQAGVPSQLTSQLGNFAQIAQNPQALAQLGAQAIAQQAVQALQQALPQLAQNLASVFGGVQGLTNALSSSIAGAAGVGTLTGGGGDDDTSESGPACSGGCPACKDCPKNINSNHQRIRAHVISEFEQHRNWLVTSYFLEYIVPAMMLMTEQLVTTGMHQVQAVGSFFDAKHKLETQRLLQQMSAKAHKDYHPSESMCKIGTNMRSLAASEKRVGLIHQGLAQGMIQRQLLSGENVSGIEGQESDRRSRGDLLINKFCNKRDAGTDIEGKTALDKLCKNNGGPQTNMDVDFISAIENKLTLELNFANDGSGPATPDEENVFALGANIFGHEVLPYVSKTKLEKDGNVNNYLDLRSIVAKRSVAQNSYSAITAMRGEGDTEVAPFLKAILKEAGVEELDIEKRLGEKPSYFAQMEVLTKDIYQNPKFYSNLYDKPANVERKSAALLAIEIMQDRDIYKSLLRSEAVLATLVEVMLSKEHQRVTEDLDNVDAEGETVEQSGGGS